MRSTTPHLLLLASLLTLTAACATSEPMTQGPLAPGQAPLSLASDATHARWGAQHTTQEPRQSARITRENVVPVHAADARLQRELLDQGFENIRRSVDQCLARVMKRDGALPAEKVNLQVTIGPSGVVDQLGLDPLMAETPMGRCLQSHRDRWRFPGLEGATLQVRRTFVLQ